ncbi:uncharacterized protein LOC111043960 [Nilaparvata lugens]|uniref:uncharacterized protein LOC111043960 n=1 Tax=Nilaparvata lugens TaxID=108931 RepID=UPI00193D17BA|nr:uncharacterized protein LOC111043960 [Nilaparvata lugens]
MRGPKYMILHLIIQGKIVGKRSVGRRRMSWLRNLREAFNCTTNDLFRAAVNKVKIAMMIANLRNGDGIGINIGAGIGIGTGISIDINVDIGIGIGTGISIDINVDIGIDIGVGIGIDIGIDISVVIGIDIGIDIGTGIGVDISVDIGVVVGNGIGVGIGINIGAGIGFDIGADIGVDISFNPTLATAGDERTLQRDRDLATFRRIPAVLISSEGEDDTDADADDNRNIAHQPQSTDLENNNDLDDPDEFDMDELLRFNTNTDIPSVDTVTLDDFLQHVGKSAEQTNNSDRDNIVNNDNDANDNDANDLEVDNRNNVSSADPVPNTSKPV